MTVPKIYKDDAANQLFDEDVFNQVIAFEGCTKLLAYAQAVRLRFAMRRCQGESG